MNRENNKIKYFCDNQEYQHFKNLSEDTIQLFKDHSRYVIDEKKGNIEVAERILEYIARLENENRKLTKRTRGLLLKNKDQYVHWKKIKNVDSYWKWRQISKDPKLTIDKVKKYRYKPLLWDIISSHKNITIKDIEDNSNLPWDWEYICRNPNIDIEFIKRNLRKRLDWKAISSNPGITMNDIKNNRHLSWKIEYVYKNPNLDKETVLHFKKYHYLGYKNLQDDAFKDQDELLSLMIEDIKERRRDIDGIYDRDLTSIIKLYIGYN